MCCTTDRQGFAPGKTHSLCQGHNGMGSLPFGSSLRYGVFSTACQTLTLRSFGHAHGMSLRMTGFGFGARGHAKHLLKTPRSKLAPGRRKSKYYLQRAPVKGPNCFNRATLDVVNPDLASLRLRACRATCRRGTCRSRRGRPQQLGGRRSDGRPDDFHGCAEGRSIGFESTDELPS